MVFREVAAGCSMEKKGVVSNDGMGDCGKWLNQPRELLTLTHHPHWGTFDLLTCGGVCLLVLCIFAWPPTDGELPRAVLSSKSFLRGSNWVDILGNWYVAGELKLE